MDSEVTTRAPHGRPRRTATRRVEVLLALVVVALSGLVLHPWTAQPASRYTLTVAVVDDHSLRLDPYEAFLTIDQARFEGHVYSDKAPYQPLVSVIPFQLFRWAGGDSFPDGFEVDDLDHATHLGLWWVTLWSSVIPGAALAVVVHRLVRRTHPAVAARVALATMVGTTVLPFTGWLFGHVLAALAVTTAWLLVRRRTTGPSAGDAALAGLCLGAGIGLEYAVAVVAVVVLVHLLWSARWAPVVWLSLGTVVATLPLLLYNWLVFRSPFELAYQGHLPNFQGEGALGVYNLEVPSLDEITKTLFGNRGLFVLTPIVLVALLGAVVAIARHSPTATDAWVAVVSLAAMLVISTGIDGYGGSSPGPRYLVPVLPLLAIPLAEAWQRFSLPCALAAVIGAAAMILAAITEPALHTEEPQPVQRWVQLALDGDLAANVLTGTSHRWILLVPTAVGILLAARVASTEARGAPST